MLKLNNEGITVLSLFDGMSCGHIALERAGIKVKQYIASEIENKPMTVTQHNYPNTIQIGDVTKVKYENGVLYYGDGNSLDVGEIDLLIGGSPCQGFSMAGRKLNFDDPRSKLFFEYHRILKEVNPKYFLLENVVMKREWEDVISEYLGVKPVLINSNLVSAQNRKRFYWTNIEGIEQPEDKGLLIKDIIYDNTYKIFTDERITKSKKKTKNYVKWDISGKQYWSQQDRAYYLDNKMCTLPKAQPANKLNICLDYEKDIYRRCHPIEAERLQTVPDNYTNVEGVSANQRLEMLGNGWTVDVIAHIFKSLND